MAQPSSIGPVNVAARSRWRHHHSSGSSSRSCSESSGMRLLLLLQPLLMHHGLLIRELEEVLRFPAPLFELALLLFLLLRRRSYIRLKPLLLLLQSLLLRFKLLPLRAQFIFLCLHELPALFLVLSATTILLIFTLASNVVDGLGVLNILQVQPSLANVLVRQYERICNIH